MNNKSLRGEPDLFKMSLCYNPFSQGRRHEVPHTNLLSPRGKMRKMAAGPNDEAVCFAPNVLTR